MGEATYYLRARYATPAAAQAAGEAFRAFIDEGAKAYDHWQANRWQAGAGAFWSTFRERFPTVARYAEAIGIAGGDHRDAPAGRLDFGGGNMDDGGPDAVEVIENELRYCATVWHGADWSDFEDWLRRETGARATGYLSDDCAAADFAQIDIA